MEYKFGEIEAKWQAQWKKDKAYKVEMDATKPKCYVLDMFPYPSGAGLHVGHPLGYIASDIYSRYKRLKGFNVLHPMGFDSFGLPAEQYALETGQHPADTTDKNIETFKAQLDKIGFCYDWDREVRTSDPSYYKWTQWIFLQLFESYFCNTQQKARPIADLIEKYEAKGCAHFTAEEWKSFDEKTKADWLMKRRLAFVSYGEVNWCEALGTVLANDEVVNGVSERGSHPVEKKKMRQWYLRITAYADRLLEGLETVQFSESMKEMQRNWIGRSEGAEMEFAVGEDAIKVYTTRPDTIFGVDFLVLAPEHDLVAKITSAEQKQAIEDYLHYVKSRSDRERMADVKQITGCFTGAYAINPFDGKKIPVWIAEYVLAGYGTGAIMAVPCGDQRDYGFAKHFSIPITNIIGEHYNGEEANATKDATLQNSGFLDGMLMKDAIGVAMDKIEELGIGKRKVNYRMRDAGFSRQRYWGEPFPIIWENGVAVPMDEKDLPLELPIVKEYGPGPAGEGPLANIVGWVDLTPDPSPEEMGDGGEKVGEGQEGYRRYAVSTPQDWKNTLPFAKENRKNPTEAEDALWQALRNRKVEDFKFRRQHPIAGYIPDFVCIECSLIIEVDGGYHSTEEQKIFDEGRSKFLLEHGFQMLRFSNEEVLEDLQLVISKIGNKLLALRETRNQVAHRAVPPLPGRGDGGEVKRRETSTMPGYAGSSWYFLRYMDPNNTGAFCSKEKSDYWNQVDLYIGGTEHAVGHLLYSRMWTKFLFDKGLISFDEPFKKLVNQGMIQGSSRFIYRINVHGVEKLFYTFLTNYFPANWQREVNNQGFNFDFADKESDYYIELKDQRKISTIYDNIKHNVKNRISFISHQEFLENFFTKNPMELEIWLSEIFAQHQYCSKKKYSNEYFVSTDLVNTDLQDGSFHIDYLRFLTLKEIDILPVDVNLVDGYVLDIGRLQTEFKNGIYKSSRFYTLDDHNYICAGEVEKMSKSKFNTVNPDQIVEKYGADTFRMYEMFLGPVEMSKPWDTKGIEGVHRFLRKLWRLFFDEVKGPLWNKETPTAAELKTLHKAIKKVDGDTETFSYNTAVSAFMVCVNELSDLKCHKLEILHPLLVMLSPYAPHIAEELWHATSAESSVLVADYPVSNEDYLKEANKEYPVSINGKMRTTITLPTDVSQADAEAAALANETVQKWLEGKAPKKVIFVKGKMVNVVI